MVNPDAVVRKSKGAYNYCRVLIQKIAVGFTQELLLIEGDVVAEVVIKVGVPAYKRPTRDKNVPCKNTQHTLLCQKTHFS